MTPIFQHRVLQLMRIGAKSSPICSKSGRRNAGAYQISTLFFRGIRKPEKCLSLKMGFSTPIFHFSCRTGRGKTARAWKVGETPEIKTGKNREKRKRTLARIHSITRSFSDEIQISFSFFLHRFFSGCCKCCRTEGKQIHMAGCLQNYSIL